ncbi:hypothetical protein SYNTR_0748 [Candidatus Syntrophocurvum alkaliphilum]|uniref:Ferrous iron transporter FeoA-like domain-containing protein n=1 Tax=Candidatus Syntrophocurvum alkaliphilum TaxID=2293317 RepID=A0A6I6DIJ1_9FIRM|nr:FeoA family protein [Candidatus Syntrophocurvum alkaliphilum]QGT99341.1 hypothetical protein SYNTR_0748 [Candidatus Syntrophocurvum alkaliphilum]
MAMKANDLYTAQVNQHNFKKEKNILKLRSGEQGIIVDTPADPLLASMGFRTGKVVSIVAKEIFNGPLVCSIDGRKVAICKNVAEKITVII